jgi:hypothetical protein
MADPVKFRLFIVTSAAHSWLVERRLVIMTAATRIWKVTT